MPENKSSMTTLISVLAIVFAMTCLVLASFMPWAELGLPEGGKLPQVLSGLANLYQSVAATLPKMIKVVAKDPNFPYYVYSFFLGAAMIAAAIALNFVGREETEKTVLPAKK